MLIFACKNIYFSLYSPKEDVWLSTTKSVQKGKTKQHSSKKVNNHRNQTHMPQVLEYLTGNLMAMVTMLKALMKTVDSMQDQMVVLAEKGKL